MKGRKSGYVLHTKHTIAIKHCGNRRTQPTLTALSIVDRSRTLNVLHISLCVLNQRHARWFHQSCRRVRRRGAGIGWWKERVRCESEIVIVLVSTAVSVYAFCAFRRVQPNTMRVNRVCQQPAEPTYREEVWLSMSWRKRSSARYGVTESVSAQRRRMSGLLNFNCSLVYTKCSEVARKHTY